MSESLPADAPAVPNRKGYPSLAWLVIVLAVVVILVARAWMEQPTGDDANAGASPNGATVLEFRARILVGTRHLLGPLAQDLAAEIDKMNQGGVDERLRVVVLTGEISGPAEALKRLDQLDALCKKHGVALTVPQESARDILRTAYLDFENRKFNAPSVNGASRVFLDEELGWFGRLALHPQGAADEGRTEAIRPADTTAIAVFSMIFLGGLFLCVGFVGLILFAVLAWNGSLTWRFQIRGSDGGVYAETFALWLVGYFGATVANSLLSLDIPYLTRGIVVMLLSLLVLFWPIARGIPWRQVRQDIGWICPANPLTEFAAGAWCYIVNLPLVALGFTVTVSLLLMYAKLQMPAGGSGESFANESIPSHPILQFLSGGDWMTLAQVFLLASVVAPLVEETMFRGVLHRHCREGTAAWRPIVSGLFSTIVVSFVFAVVHPQGLMVVPVLMSMAFGFSLAREWRASLLPSIFAHGMSNGIVLTVATIALSN